MERCILRMGIKGLEFHHNEKVYSAADVENYSQKSVAVEDEVFAQHPDMVIFKNSLPILFEEDKQSGQKADISKCFKLSKHALAFYRKTVAILTVGSYFTVYLFTRGENNAPMAEKTHEFDLKDEEEWISPVCSLMMMLQEILSQSTDILPSNNNNNTSEKPKENTSGSSGRSRGNDPDKSPPNPKKSLSGSNPKSGTRRSTLVNKILSSGFKEMNIRGANAQVFVGMYQQHQAALAKVAKNSLVSSDHLPIEVHVLKLLAGVSGVPSLLHWEPVGTTHYLIYEQFVPGSWTITSWTQFSHIFRQSLTLLCLLHERNIIHGDIKPSNLLYDPLRNMLFLLDFDSATVLPSPGAFMTELWVGSKGYRAPELESRQKNKCSFGVDVWSLGKTLSELVRKFLGIEGNEKVGIVWKSSRKEANWELYSKIILRMLENDPKVRISAEEALALLKIEK